MKLIRPLFIKFIMMTALLWIVLGGFFGVNFADILITSIILTVVAFVIGDLFILPRFGNITAVIADFGLALLGVWMLGALFFEPPISLGAAAFVSAIGTAVAEIFFHLYMEKQVFHEESDHDQINDLPSQEMLQTEFGSELEPETKPQEELIDRSERDS